MRPQFRDEHYETMGRDEMLRDYNTEHDGVRGCGCGAENGNGHGCGVDGNHESGGGDDNTLASK